MHLQNLEVELKHRTHYAAIDVGSLIAQRYFWHLFAGWLVIALPTFIGAWFLPGLFWPLFLLWFCKPLYERIPVKVVSKVIFGERAKWHELPPSVLSADMLVWNSIFRLCPGRSFLTPIATLEGLPVGQGAIRARRTTLKPKMLGSYLLIHLGCFFMELALIVFLIFVAITFTNTFGTSPASNFLNILEVLNWLVNTNLGQHVTLSAFFLAYGVVAPFYVCGGFALYLNRRIELEGWDLEVGFRQLVTRVATPAILLMVLLPASEAYSQEENEDQLQIRQELVDISENELIAMETTRVPKQPSNQMNRTRTSSPLMNLFAFTLQVLVWMSVIGLVLWIIFKSRIWELLGDRKAQAVDTTVEPEIVDDAPTDFQLPPNLVRASQLAWEAGNQREAISLLYRGALTHLIVGHDCPINIHHTESTCRQLVSRNVPQLAKSFRLICNEWLNIAYGSAELATSQYQTLVKVYEESFC